jgi:hypothetical protein
VNLSYFIKRPQQTKSSTPVFDTRLYNIKRLKNDPFWDAFLSNKNRAASESIAISVGWSLLMNEQKSTTANFRALSKISIQMKTAIDEIIQGKKKSPIF